MNCCPSLDTLIAYALGEPMDDAAEIAAHTDGCDGCMALIGVVIDQLHTFCDPVKQEAVRREADESWQIFRARNGAELGYTSH